MRMFTVVDYDGQTVASFSEKYLADEWMKEANKCSEFNGPLALNILVADSRINERATRFWQGTIQIDSGKVTRTLEGMEMVGPNKTFVMSPNHNKCYLEGKSYIGYDHLVSSLMLWRETYCKAAVGATT